VGEVLKGLRRAHGVRPNQKAPITVTELRAMVAGLDGDLAGIRDRALLVLGMAGAFRRSELAALGVTDLTFVDEGVLVLVRKSKCDQNGRGVQVGVPFGSDPQTCPVRSIKAWLNAAALTAGPLFRRVTVGGRTGAAALDPGSIARIVKRAAGRVGLDASRFSGHSLRSGLATAAAKAKKSLVAIMAQGRWKTDRVARSYVRLATVWDDNGATGIGL
jgi:integrase